MSTAKRTAVAGVALGTLLVSGCSGDGSDRATSDPSSSATSATAAAPSPLPVGKSDLDLEAGTYTSPEGFEPALEIEVPEGWQSVHRGADAFDFGKPDPTKDAPLVAVVVLRPPEPTAAAAIAAIRERAPSAMPVDVAIGAASATGLDIVGGKGQVVASADGGIALDAAPGQRMRVLALDAGGTPYVVVVLVPDGDSWPDALPAAEELYGGISVK